MTQPSQQPAAGDASSSAAVPAPARDHASVAPGHAAPELPTTSSSDGGSDASDARLTWLIGGSLLVANAVLSLMLSGNPLFALPGAGLVIDGVWAAGLLVLAFGIRGRGSVVGRRPLGIAGLAIAAIVPLLTDLLWWIVPAEAWNSTSAFMAGNGMTVLSLCALIVATVVIGRAAAVPHRLRWVPLIVLAVVAGAQIVLSIASVAYAQTRLVPDLTGAYYFAATLRPLGVLLLGILAIVSAPRPAPPPAPPTQVYPPAS